MNTASFLFTLVVVLFSDQVHGLYEDQIGKFDWKKEYVGEVKFSKFDNGINFHEIVYVATEQNVVASLALKTGEIKWRNILEKGSRGFINSLSIVNNVIFVVSGTDVITVRGWNAKYGYLTHQWSYQLPILDSIDEKVFWFAREIILYQIIVKSDKTIDVTTYKIFNGEKLSEKTFNAPNISVTDKCAMSESVLLCINDLSKTAMVNYTQGVEISSKNLDEIVTEGERFNSVKASYENAKSTFILSTANKKIIYFENDKTSFAPLETIPIENGDVFVTKLDLDTSPIGVTVKSISTTEIEMGVIYFKNKQTSVTKRFTLNQPIGNIEISNADCYKQSSSNVFCAVLLSTSDGSFIYLDSEGKNWVREEGLSSIITVEFIELPMSDTEAEMQKEFDTKELLDYVLQAADVFNMFYRRISSHIFQLHKVLLSISGIIEKSFSVESQENRLVRDYFNLHKIILVITRHQKIYAIDNINKEILWSYLLSDEYEPFLAPIEEFGVKIPFFIQRSYRHYPHPMQCTILFKNRKTQNGALLSFNPVTGKFELPIELNYKIKQAMLIPKTTPEDHLQGIMLMDENNAVHVFPKRTLRTLYDVAPNLYIYVANADACEVNGYNFSSDLTNMTLVPAWKTKCSGKIIKISGKNPIEKVHSQGRVLADRSVLYKYINPNLIAFVVQDINMEDQKSMLTLHFIDSVTGVIVNSDVRHRAYDPVHLVHSENWVVLMYFNDKARRTEVVTFELHEGKTQKNSTAFSSLQTMSSRPIVDSKAYILPTSYIEAAKETITEKGITSKHVLVALSTGSIVEIPWVILDPRRPYASTPETKEENVIPYMPEIPIPTETMINYNRTLHRIRGLVTSPSGLESTSLVFVYGLDLFYTRTAPSKTFDLLKEDFDYTLIIIVLVLLIVSTIITKHFAYKRALKQAWR